MSKLSPPGPNEDDSLPDTTGSPFNTVSRLLTEGLIGTGASARLFGQMKGGRPVHPGTIVRWHLKGVRTSDSRTICLEAIRVGGKLMTSRPALVRFLAEQQFVPRSNPLTSRTPSERSLAAKAAGKQLEEAGA